MIIDDIESAHAALVEIAKVERAIANAYQPIASSLMVDGKTGVEKYLKDRKDALKLYIENHGNEPVTDGELSVKAHITPRVNPATYDIESMLKRTGGGETLKEAAEHGVIRVDDAALIRYRKQTAGAAWADMLYMFRMQHGATSVLHIEAQS